MTDATNNPDSVQPHALVRYDAACRAVAEAITVDEVREITAKADAIRAYAKQASNRELEVQAAEIRIRAERRLGELMIAQGEAVGKAKGAKGIGTSAGYQKTRTPDEPPTLAEAGIDKNLAHRAWTYAAVPEEKFEKLLTEKRQRDNRRVVLDPELQADAEAEARAEEAEREDRIVQAGERIALAGADGLVADNEKLKKQVHLLDRRIASLLEENGSLKFREKMWKERAIAAGWKGRADAA